MKKFTVKNIKDLEYVADYILENLNDTCIALKGDLGAGKTTLTQVLAKKLGVKEKVNSPTFVIMKEYKTESSKFKKLLHMDAYRLEGKDDIKAFDFDQILQNKDSLLIVEWPEKLGNLDCPSVEIKYIDEIEREITLNF